MPSKALLAVSGRMRELQNEHHMKAFGLQVVKIPVECNCRRSILISNHCEASIIFLALTLVSFH